MNRTAEDVSVDFLSRVLVDVQLDSSKVLWLEDAVIGWMMTQIEGGPCGVSVMVVWGGQESEQKFLISRVLVNVQLASSEIPGSFDM
jgi:hypothetical protein